MPDDTRAAANVLLRIGDLAIRVCELATRHAAAFAAMLETWPAEHRARKRDEQAAHDAADGPWPSFPDGALIDGGTPEPTPAASGPFAPEWLPVRPLSIAEQAAHLAALHDARCECGRKLGPWQAQANGESPGELLGLLVAAGWFARLVIAARDDERVELARIGPMLAAVEAELAPAGAATTDDGAAQWNSLNDNQRAILRNLDTSASRDAESRRSAGSIALALVGDRNESRISRDLSKLVRLGFVVSRTGAGGGYWISPLGAALVAQFGQPAADKLGAE